MAVLDLRKKLSSELEVKSFDDETGTVTALVNSLGVVDADGDRLLSGAFDNSMENLEKEPIAVLWGHDSLEVVGKVLDGYEIGMSDHSALYAEMLFNLKTQRGRDAYEDVKFGAVAQWSVGFNVPEGALDYVTDPDGVKVTNIKEVKLVEISAVLRGSSPGTATISIKSVAPEKAVVPGKPDKYTTAAEARNRADELGCSGIHIYDENDEGETIYMPCSTHDVYESIVNETETTGIYSQDIDTTQDHAMQQAAAAIKAAAAREVARVKLAWLKTQTKGKK
tara:strand:- start:474 stop:1313 length:840 start_codon:yes stop_codon:yes gene_type:complete